MANNLKIYKDEEGDSITINLKTSLGADFVTSWAVLADTTIVIKSVDLVDTKLTVTSANISNSTPRITWTPDTAHIATSLGKGKFRAFVHLRDDSDTREVIAEFTIEVLDN